MPTNINDFLNFREESLTNQRNQLIQNASQTNANISAHNGAIEEIRGIKTQLAAGTISFEDAAAAVADIQAEILPPE